MILLFWIFIGLILYTYIGYPIVLLIIRIFIPENKTNKSESFELPEVTMLIAAYNEADIIPEKLENTFKLDYPKNKLKLVWITDGSTDNSPELLAQFPEIRVLHIPERKGKTAAINRALDFINTPFLVFSDANTMLESQSIKELIQPFIDKYVGCVAGKKQIAKNIKDMAAGSGEGGYWQFETFLKQLESDVNLTLGAAGELYAIRTDLFKKAPEDTIIDDFIISLKIASLGYKIKFASKAVSTEDASLNIREELKRKIRIASGGFQTLFRYPGLLNFYKHGFLSFQYLSHKVLRWLVAPLAIFSLPLINIFICIDQKWNNPFYNVLLFIQILFALIVITGFLFEKKNIRFKSIFLPYYFIVMNYAQIAGLIRYLRKKQPPDWAKALRNK